MPAKSCSQWDSQFWLSSPRLSVARLCALCALCGEILSSPRTSAFSAPLRYLFPRSPAHPAFFFSAPNTVITFPRSFLTPPPPHLPPALQPPCRPPKNPPKQSFHSRKNPQHALEPLPRVRIPLRTR